MRIIMLEVQSYNFCVDPIYIFSFFVGHKVEKASEIALAFSISLTWARHDNGRHIFVSTLFKRGC